MSHLGLGLTDLLAAATLAGIAALHEPHAAIAAAVSYATLALITRRAIALLACVAIALGLIAADDHQPRPTPAAAHGRTPH